MSVASFFVSARIRVIACLTGPNNQARISRAERFPMSIKNRARLSVLLLCGLAAPLTSCFEGVGRNGSSAATGSEQTGKVGVSATGVATAGTVGTPLLPNMVGYRNISATDAEALNAAIPLVSRPLAAARPFLLDASVTPDARAAAVDCLTSAIYYEAASEDEAGQRAVAQVVLNRLRDPAFPKTVCDVVFQGAERATGCQFSFSCDGSLARLPSQAGWLRARRYAQQALAGHVESDVGVATHYHTQQVVPIWRLSLDKIAVLGAHIFYTIPGRKPATGPAGLARTAAPGKPATVLMASLPSAYLLSFVQPTPPASPVGIADQKLASANTAPAAPVKIALLADEKQSALRADQQSGSLLTPIAKALP